MKRGERSYRRLLVGMFFVIFAIAGVASEPAQKSINAILDLGKEMSQMRNMLETYALIATNVKYKLPEKRLKESIKGYESLIARLEKEFSDPEIRQSLARSKKAWEPLKKSLVTAFKKPDPNQMTKEGLFIHSHIRSVIKELAGMKRYLLEKEKIENGKELNAAIEIAASSQRLSAHYMMKMWGLPDPTIQKHWDNGVRIYTESIGILKGSKYYQDAHFKKLLKSTERQLKYFQTVFTLGDNYMPVVVHNRAEKAYRAANEMSRIILGKK